MPFPDGRLEEHWRPIRPGDTSEPDADASPERDGRHRPDGHYPVCVRPVVHGRPQAVDGLRRQHRRADGSAAIVPAKRRRAGDRGPRPAAGAHRVVAEADRRADAQPGRVPRESEMTPKAHERLTKFAGVAALAGFIAAAGLHAAGADRKESTHEDAWSTYYGDYSGRRYSALKQIDVSNIRNLALSWIYRANLSSRRAIVGGEGTRVEPLDEDASSIK